MTITELDIWRAANMLIGRYGDNAEFEAARRADQMLDRGDRDGQLLWLRIVRATRDLHAGPVGLPH